MSCRAGRLGRVGCLSVVSVGFDFVGAGSLATTDDAGVELEVRSSLRARGAGTRDADAGEAELTGDDGADGAEAVSLSGGEEAGGWGFSVGFSTAAGLIVGIGALGTLRRAYAATVVERSITSRAR